MAHNIASLFRTYIGMRQEGGSMDEVVNRLQEAAQQLPRDERHRLGTLVMEWEEKYGNNPRQSPPPGPAHEDGYTPAAAPIPGEPSVEPPRPQPQPASTFGTRYLDPSKTTSINRAQAAPPVSCPHCGTPNAAGSTICRTCGQLIQVRPAAPTRRLGETAPKLITMLTDHFTQNSILIIAIRGAKNTLEAFPREKMIIGRGFSPVHGQPFLDLTPYDGEKLGVSRYHAEIRFLNNTLVITDLDSDNGTFINDSRLYPYEIRVLHNNDELRLGRLYLKITFKVPLRR